MKNLIKSCLTFLLILNLTPIFAQKVDAGDSLIVLQNITIIDGLGNEPVSGQNLIIKGKRIWKITNADAPVPTESKVIDLSGSYIMPGIVESHSHLLPPGSDFRKNNTYMLDKLEHALLGGITTIRDMGGDARFLAPFKRAAQLDQIISPNLHYSALMAGPAFFSDPRAAVSSQGVVPGSGPWMPQITKDTNITEAIAAAKGTGATGIKLYMDMDTELVTRLSAEAHRQGLQVWAHPYIGPAQAMDLIEAGADAISHAGHLLIEVKGFETYRKPGFWEYQGNAPELKVIFEAMKAKGVFLEPTIFVYDVIEKLDIPGYYNDSSTVISQQIIREAYDIGVQMILGTDTVSNNPSDPYPHIHKEMYLLAEGAGIPTLDLIKAATYNGAKNLGIDADYGSIEPGKVANLIVLNQNPVANIRNTQRIRLVIKNGRLYHRKED